MHNIKINCKIVYDSGKNFADKSEKISQIAKRLNDSSDKIKEAWEGEDGHNFLESFNSHIFELGNVSNYLKDNGSLFKSIALNHGNVHEEFVRKAGRSDIDEHRI